jgi:hypothetical protein
VEERDVRHAVGVAEAEALAALVDVESRMLGVDAIYMLAAAAAAARTASKAALTDQTDFF